MRDLHDEIVVALSRDADLWYFNDRDVWLVKTQDDFFVADFFFLLARAVEVAGSVCDVEALDGDMVRNALWGLFFDSGPHLLSTTLPQLEKEIFFRAGDVDLQRLEKAAPRRRGQLPPPDPEQPRSTYWPLGPPRV